MDSDTDAERQRRLEALRNLSPQGAADPAAPALTSATVSPIPPVARTPRRKRMWLYAGLAGALVIALVVGVYARFAAGPLATTGSDHPLAPTVLRLPVGAGVYCPSQPAWSPDGRYVAVMATTSQPGGDGWCNPYDDLVSSMAAQGLQANGFSGSDAWALTALVLDAKTGAAVQRLTTLDPTSALCTGADDCGTDVVKAVSLSWSPDNATVCVFATMVVFLTGKNGQSYSQYRGALEVMRADGTGRPTLLVTHGRAMIADNQNLAVNLYSPPRFTWNLETGAATYVDIHEAAGLETVDYAPAFQVGPAAQLTALTPPASAAGSVSPWSHGVLFDGGEPPGQLPTIQLNASGWAWSADGRYVTPNINVNAQMNVAKVTSGAPSNIPGAYNPPFVAPPDIAAAAVVSEIAPRKVVAYVARDPSGKRLAAFICQPDGDTGKLTVRASATGKILATTLYRFPTLSTSFGCLGDAEGITWSPDGSRVALTDNQDSQIVIWQIPK